jgi:hypothetical protein
MMHRLRNSHAGRSSLRAPHGRISVVDGNATPSTHTATAAEETPVCPNSLRVINLVQLEVASGLPCRRAVRLGQPCRSDWKGPGLLRVLARTRPETSNSLRGLEESMTSPTQAESPHW